MKAKKSLGQNFLICPWVVDEIIEGAELSLGDTVLEIGPGTGVLTRPLAAHAKKVIAVEKDEYLAEKLRTALAREKMKNVEIITGDAISLFQTKSRISRLSLESEKYKIVANIPYYLTSHLLRLVLEHGPRPCLAVLTIQKEVAERITARPPDMSILGLSVQVFCTPRIIKTVPASCFFPKPKVDSAIIKLSDISDNFFTKNKIKPDLFFKIIRSAFGQKRKILANSLASIAGDKKTALEILHATKINQSSRPEELTLNEWTALCRAVFPVS